MPSLTAGTIMGSSNLEDHVWAIDCYPLAAFLKGIASMQPHREIGIGHKAAWSMPHRFRAVFDSGCRLFSGPVDVDETGMNGGLKTIPNRVRKELSERCPLSKMAGAFTKCRGTNQTAAEAMLSTDYEDVNSFIKDLADQQAKACTAEAIAYEGSPYEDDAVRYLGGEYVRGQALTNGVKSFWSVLKRGCFGTFHKILLKQVQRYIEDFSDQHSVRDPEISEPIAGVARNAHGKGLRYKNLIGDHGLVSRARLGGDMLTRC